MEALNEKDLFLELMRTPVKRVSEKANAIIMAQYFQSMNNRLEERVSDNPTIIT